MFTGLRWQNFIKYISLCFVVHFGGVGLTTLTEHSYTFLAVICT